MTISVKTTTTTTKTNKKNKKHTRGLGSDHAERLKNQFPSEEMVTMELSVHNKFIR